MRHLSGGEDANDTRAWQSIVCNGERDEDRDLARKLYRASDMSQHWEDIEVSCVPTMFFDFVND